MYKVGMVVLNYNAEMQVLKLIETISEYNSIHHIVVVDNASTTNVKQTFNKISNCKVDFIYLEENMGYASGQNAGSKYLIEKYKVDYLIISTPAVSFDENFVTTICDCLEQSNEYAILSGVMLDFNNNLTDRIGWKRPTYMECLLDSLYLFRRFYRKFNKYTLNSPDVNGIIEVDVVIGALFIIRSNIFKKVNYFDENTFLFYEENILSAKLNKINLKEGVVKNISFKHASGFSTKKNTKSEERFKYLMNSKYIYASKYLNISNFKALLLRISINIGILEKKIMNMILSFRSNTL